MDAITELLDGPIDMHCHLIPGVDDGCQTVRQSLDCIRQMQRRGYVGSVCTPHVFPRLFPDNTPTDIARFTAELQREVDEAGIDYRLWPGGELRIDETPIAWMAEHGVPTLGGSRYVLCDQWSDDWLEKSDALCRHLIDRGYTPILAHPERMPLDDATLGKLLDRLGSMGVLLQGNLNCFAGGEGPAAAVWARRLLREGRYFLLASDLHDPGKADGRFEGLAIAEIEAGPEKLAEMIVTNPRKILGGL